MVDNRNLADLHPKVQEAYRLLDRPQRQSVFGLFMSFLDVVRALRGFSVTIVAGFVFAQDHGWLIVGLLVVALVGTAAWSVAEWWRFVFCVDGGRLNVVSGVVSERRQVVSLDRIQSVTVEQSALHRLVGVVRVSIESAGSGDFAIEAVNQKIARSLQLLVEEHGAGGGPSTSHDTLAGQASVDSELVATVTDSVAFDVAQNRNGDDVELAHEVVAQRTFRSLWRAAAARAPLAGFVGVSSLLPFTFDFLPKVEFSTSRTSILLLLALTATGAGVVWAVNIGQDIVRNWGLAVTRSRAGLRRTAGLVATTSASTTIERVQGIKTWQNPLERFWSIRRVTLPTIGSGDMKIPGSTDDELRRIRELVLGATSQTHADRRVSLWVIYRDAQLALGVALPLVLAASYLSLWFLVGLVFPLWALARSYVTAHTLRWGLAHGRLVVSRSFVVKHKKEQLLVKLQSVSVTRSWLERRKGLASLVFFSAEARVVIPMIDVSTARNVRDEVLAVLAIDRSPWM